MIRTLTLTNFRNHVTTRINTCDAKNIIITGPNGGGKTAVLEALSMLCGDRGLRGAPWGDIARFDAGQFAVFSELGDDTTVGVSWQNGDANRRAKIDGDNATLGDLAGLLRIIWLTPYQDRIFTDGATERRAWFDRLVAGFDATHMGRVARLSRLCSERAFALKSGADENWLNALDMQISAVAIAISAARINFAGQINYFLGQNQLSVSVSGMTESLLLENDAATAEKKYLEYLGQNRMLQGDKMILDGAHKSNFGVFNGVLNLPAAITSTGQQKAALIDLILAYAKLVHARTDMRPIILLDEAVAHLDENARNRMFAEMRECDAQVWVAGQDVHMFKNIPDSIFVTCADGMVSGMVV